MTTPCRASSIPRRYATLVTLIAVLTTACGSDDRADGVDSASSTTSTIDAASAGEFAVGGSSTGTTLFTLVVQ